MGGLGSGPSLKMGGFQSGYSRKKKKGFLELKITKKPQEITFLKRGSFRFSIYPGRKSGKNNYKFLKRRSFRAAQVEKESLLTLGAAKAEKWGWGDGGGGARLSRSTHP